MRITNRRSPATNERNVGNKAGVGNRSTTIVNNVTQVTIEAPAGSTADHRAVDLAVPAQAHLAAALPPIGKARPIRVGEPAAQGGARERGALPGGRVAPEPPPPTQL